MTSPLFRSAIVAEPYEEPDYDQIQQERDLVDEGLWHHPDPHGYRPAAVDDDELRRITERMVDNGIELSEDNVRHAIEGEEIRKLLRRYGIGSRRKVSETQSGEGNVKLTFHELRTLVEKTLGDAVGEESAVTSG